MLTIHDGNAITYDGIGNPLNDGEWTYTWQNGRQLAAMSNSNRTWTFTYDANGMRTSRSPGYERGTYTYTYNGSKLTQMEVEGYTFRFSYDASGTPVSFTMDNSLFFYETNLQGDVVGIWDQDGIRLVHYAYDAWGNVQILQNHQIAEFNPLMYRGYVYDFETGLYYIHSRYYNPEVGRFLNSDIIASTGQGILGNNMFAYCGNNPVVRVEVGGYFWDIVFDVVSLVVSIVEVVNDPEDVFAWVGLALDIVDVVIPFVGGLGEAADAVSTAVKITDAVDNSTTCGKFILNTVDGFSKLSKAKEYGIKAYKELRKVLKGTGLEAHHIIEQRLVRHLDIKVQTMLSVALTPAEHQVFTNAWRRHFKYGMVYDEISKDVLWEAAKIIYKDYPKLIEASWEILYG